LRHIPSENNIYVADDVSRGITVGEYRADGKKDQIFYANLRRNGHKKISNRMSKKLRKRLGRNKR
jgi:hypothetical protein